MVEGNAKPLLSRSTAELLGVLRINANYVVGEDEFSNRLVNKGWNWLSPRATVTTPHRPFCTADCYKIVLFHRREKVEKEIQMLVDADIIERVTDGPTEWVSRIVTPPKPKKTDEIRLCVDMRDANKAILRTRHVSPTLDELITKLNGATMRSGLPCSPETYKYAF